MAPKRRPPTPAQRSAKIEADRLRRRERKIEFSRLQNLVTELQTLVETQRNELTNLTDEVVPNLLSTVQRQREQIHELTRQNQELNMSLENSFCDIDQFLNLKEEPANNEPVTDGASTSQNGRGLGGFEESNIGEED